MPKETKDEKIARLEKACRFYEDEVERLHKRNKELVDAEEKTFLHSPTYLQMKEHINFVKNLLELTEGNLASQKKAARKASDTIRQIYEDNRNLTAEKADRDYFVGITENYRAAWEYQKLKDENIRLSADADTLKGSVKERDAEIERLQMLLAENQLEKQQADAEFKKMCERVEELENALSVEVLIHTPRHTRR